MDPRQVMASRGCGTQAGKTSSSLIAFVAEPLPGSLTDMIVHYASLKGVPKCCSRPNVTFGENHPQPTLNGIAVLLQHTAATHASKTRQVPRGWTGPVRDTPSITLIGNSPYLAYFNRNGVFFVVEDPVARWAIFTVKIDRASCRKPNTLFHALINNKN